MALILIIQEDVDISALMKRVLDEQGHETLVVKADEGRQRWLEEKPWDRVIVCGGKYGEKVQRRLFSLKEAGVDGASIILAVGRQAVDEIQRLFGDQVRGVISTPPDTENLRKLLAFSSVTPGKPS